VLESKYFVWVKFAVGFNKSAAVDFLVAFEIKAKLFKWKQFSSNVGKSQEHTWPYRHILNSGLQKLELVQFCQLLNTHLGEFASNQREFQTSVILKEWLKISLILAAEIVNS